MVEVGELVLQQLLLLWMVGLVGLVVAVARNILVALEALVLLVKAFLVELGLEIVPMEINNFLEAVVARVAMVCRVAGYLLAMADQEFRIILLVITCYFLVGEEVASVIPAPAALEEVVLVVLELVSVKMLLQDSIARVLEVEAEQIHGTMA